MQVSPKQAAGLLLEQDNIVIFAHRKPDGDALGSSFALYYALAALGKRARVECADPLLAGRYEKILGPYAPQEFKPAFLVSADVADRSLLAGVEEPYGGTVHLCIDHHKSNDFYAQHTLVDAGAAATAELVWAVIREMGAPCGVGIANAIYLGLSTDTGCFRFSNTTANTHRVAAEVIALGADHGMINKLMFETKSRGRLEVERLVMKTLSFHFDDRCAVVFLPGDVAGRYGVEEEELDGISAMPRAIEGVLAGITIREREGGVYRISVRTQSPMDASAICRQFGGGGHMNAAGCVMTGELDEIRERLLAAVEQALPD